ncbi:MAG: hypothetical protein ACU837_10660 [Gammaproteobacteria bacterium]
MNAIEREIKSLAQTVHVPVMTQEKFSELTGVKPGVLRGWIDKDYLPSVLVGKHRLVNIVKLASDCLAQS